MQSLFLAAINSIIYLLEFLKIKASENDDMRKLELLSALFIHMCKRKIHDAKDGQNNMLQYLRMKSEELGHFDLPFFLMRTDQWNAWMYDKVALYLSFLSAYLAPIL